MKKILIAVILIVLFLPSLVLAASDKFYEGEYLPDAYIKKFKNGATTGKYEQMRMFRRVSDNSPAYCIELWENLTQNEEMNSVNITVYNLIPEEVLKKIELYAYYGYGYQNHTDLNWYIATQFLIWKETSPDSNIYFTDKLNGNKVAKYTNEMNEIISLVNNHNILPSFNENTYNLGLNEEIIIEDTNNVLPNFKVVTNYSYPTSKSNNTLKVRANKVGTVNIVLEKGNNNNLSQIYTSNTSQDLLVRGDYRRLASYIKLNVTGGKIKISKIDYDTKSYISEGEINLNGTSYDLYNSDNKKIQTINIDSNGNGSTLELPYGTYYLKEKTTGRGYQIDNTKHEVTLTKESPIKTLTLPSEKIKSKIILHKLYKPLNSEITYDESDTIFIIYNDNNEEVNKLITDKDGLGEIILPYGTYKVSQISGKENYKRVEDFTINIDENTKSEIKYELITEEYGSTLEIINIDKESKLPIRLSSIGFKIKDILNNEYISYSQTDTFKTDKNGTLTLPLKLRTGKYQIEEVKEPLGYIKNKPIIFEVLKDKDSKIDIIIESEKEYGRLEIIKSGETITINNDRLEYRKELLPNIEYSLYSNEDIITSDGITHYKKNQFITKQITDENGKIVFNNLIYGKYYVIESKCLESYNADFNKYYVEINKNNLLHTLEKISTLKKANIKINKLDSLSLLPIYDVEFEIYNKDNIKIDTLKTNQNGEIFISNLPLGKYYIKETKAPFPYLIDKKIIEVELTDNEEVIEVNLKNDKQHLEIEIPNTNTENNNISSNLYTLFIINLFIYYIKFIKSLI